MSYCRFSTDGFRCDIYCYEHAGGWYQIEVARNRIVVDDDYPQDPGFTRETIESGEYIKYHNALMDWLQTAERESIGLDCDGDSYSLDLEGCIDRLVALRDMGYQFPDEVIDNLREEAMEEDSRTEEE